jgi:hypothetical protein
MPIQFRCGACNQLLGIATRKAGAVVNCPTCGNKTIVPREAAPKAAAAPAKPKSSSGSLSLLERVDVEALLKAPAPGKAVEPGSDVGDQPYVATGIENPGAPVAVLPLVDVEPVHESSVSLAPAARSPGAFLITVTPVRAAIAVAALVALLAGAFLAGMWFATKESAPRPDKDVHSCR